jgi:hypothetical protein
VLIFAFEISLYFNIAVASIQFNEPVGSSITSSLKLQENIPKLCVSDLTQMGDI